MTSLHIEGYRAFRGLTIPSLGAVNLLTGRNNTGKSSILEAIRILASNGAPSVIGDIMRFREEDRADSEETDGDALSQASGLFHGFPSEAKSTPVFSIAASNGSRPLHVAVSIGRFLYSKDPDGRVRLMPAQGALFDEDDVVPGLAVESNSSERLYPIHRFLHRSRSLAGLLEEPGIPCIHVDAYAGERTSTLAPLWDKVSLTDDERTVIDALRIIQSDIVGLSMIGGEDPRRPRTAIVRAKNFRGPVPLRTFGDGLNRLFGIALSLVGSKNGILLIDEFENGMHFEILREAWKLIFKLSRELSIQVFATTHNWDAIEAFQAAASADAGDGVLVRLSRNGDDIVPAVFQEDELAIVTRDKIEVR